MGEMKVERRMMTLQPLQDDADDIQSRTVEGYVAVFNEDTLMWKSDYTGYEYREIILPGAFDNTDFSKCVLNYNHGGMLLARTASDTLKLAVDERGLKLVADIADTSIGNDVYQLIKRGDLTKMSFAFVANGEEEEIDRENKVYTRKIKSVKAVYDVSIVDNPAYEGTTINTRDSGDYERYKLVEQRKRLMLLAMT